MPPIVIPYASSAPYDNSAYVSRMADLMLRRGDVTADALRRAGDARAQMWSNVGNVALSTLSQIGAARDAERQRALLLKQQEFENAMKQRDYDLREREMESAAADREAARKWQEMQFRENSADRAIDRIAVGTVISPDDYKRYDGTSAAESLEYQPARDARLSAKSMLDARGMDSYQPVVQSSIADDPTVAGFQPGVGVGPREQDFPQWLPSYKMSMSDDVAARPEGYKRVPTQAELVQQQNLQMQQENQLRDDRRAEVAAQAAMANQLRDDEYRVRSDQERNDLRRQSLEIQRWMAENGQDQRKTTNMLAISGQVKSHPAYTKMLDFENGLEAVETGLNVGDGAGDITAINAFQRLVDPGVSVREGDVKLLQSASSWLARMNPSYWIEQLKQGSKLPPETREAMRTLARQMYAARARTYSERVGDVFKQQAAAAGVPYGLVARDFPVPDYSTAQPNGGGFFNDPNRRPQK
jgi:hypothetical protein